MIRRVCELAAGPDFYVASFSSRTLVYKGMLISYQVAQFFPDLVDERMESAMGLVHSRFSTNTFPSWELAHPYRVIAHNGEINTLMGNVNWMRARESQLASELFGKDLPKVMPIVRPGGSDSATFDNVLELLMLAGRSLPHAVMMMIPEAYDGREDLTDELKAFYEFHASFMEPWDGPAAVCFTDGNVIGATLDRNGLRPGRWVETHDGWLVLGSEAGLLGITPDRVKRLGRLQPGKIFLVDLAQGRIVEDDEVKREISTQSPYRAWIDDHQVHFEDLPDAHYTQTGLLPVLQAPARLRLLPGGPARPDRADGQRGRRADRLDGQRQRPGRPVGPPPAAVLLLQAAVRPGDQPADRPDPRGGRDVAGQRHRARAQPPGARARARPPARAQAADPAQHRAREAQGVRARDLRDAHAGHDLARRRRARRAWPRAWPRCATRPTTRCRPAPTS